MNIFNNIYDNEVEREDDWGWFIRLDLDNTRPTTNTNKKTHHMCNSLQSIDENKEYYDIDFNPNPNPKPKPKPSQISTKNTFLTLKPKYDFLKNLLIYGLFYNCIYLEQIYKCINPFWCYKQKINN
jgi:hypothetical protein